ncbi:MAG: hypothetical protein Q8O38_14970 [Sulfurimicrobium sp.]|nr:hypothetical protein [Sulfurimicrobium sp.]
MEIRETRLFQQGIIGVKQADTFSHGGNRGLQVGNERAGLEEDPRLSEPEFELRGR